MTEPAVGVEPTDISSPVTANTVTAAAVRKALVALKLGDVDTLESVLVVPGQMVVVHTRNSDGTTTTKQLALS